MLQQNRSYYVYAYLRSRDSERGLRLSPYYIGKGSGNRAYEKKRSIAKPSDNSYIVFLEEGLTECEAFALEKYAIALYGRIDKGGGILWNMTDGGEGCSGIIMSQETRDKIANALRGKSRPRSVIEKMLQARAGFQHSEATKRKMSKTRTGRKRGPLTPEWKLKVSQGKARYEYEITDLDGNRYTTTSLKQFCKDHGLHQGHMSAAARGETSGHKGWQVRITQELLIISDDNGPNRQRQSKDEVKMRKKEQKRLYDKARYQRSKAKRED